MNILLTSSHGSLQSFSFQYTRGFFEALGGPLPPEKSSGESRCIGSSGFVR